MITLAKLKEYEEYHGFYDGFYLQKVSNGSNITKEDEWYLIGNFIQDVRLGNKGLASKEFVDNLNSRLKDSCDTEETINQLKKLADMEW